MPNHLALLLLTDRDRDDLAGAAALAEELRRHVDAPDAAVVRAWAVAGADDLVLVLDLPDDEVARRLAGLLGRLDRVRAEAHLVDGHAATGRVIAVLDADADADAASGEGGAP
ncbi:MAG: hypothetical protein IPM45_04420 [Acidimicrobiales bacterium]|nr:hypothetical protein [Acidimicrobiales bacterium]